MGLGVDTAVVATNTVPLATGEPVFRFFDNRQKYLLFVNTCSEKWVVAQRVAMELGNIYPRPPALRIFDAGVGDGTVLTRVMRAMHQRFPTCQAISSERRSASRTSVSCSTRCPIGCSNIRRLFSS